MPNNASHYRPYVVDTKNLLEAPGYDLADHDPAILPEAGALKSQQEVPPLLVDDEPIGDHEDLMRWLARNAH
jgi:hypothetical protein